MKNLNNEDSIYYHRAIDKIENQDYKGAIEDANFVIKLNKDYVSSAYVIRGFCNYRLKNNEESFTDFNKAIDINPDNSLIYKIRGICKNENWDYEGAIEDFNKSIKLNPEDDTAKENLELAKKNLEVVTSELNRWLNDFNQHERELIQDFIDYAYCTKSLNYLTNFDEEIKNRIIDQYKYEWYVLKEEEAFYYKYENKQGVQYFNKAIEICPEKYLPYILYIKKNWKAKENVEKALTYCKIISKLATKNEDLELLEKIKEVTTKFETFLIKNNTDKEEKKYYCEEPDYETYLQRNYLDLHLKIENILVNRNYMKIDDIAELLQVSPIDIEMEIYANSDKFEKNVDKYGNDIIYLKY